MRSLRLCCLLAVVACAKEEPADSAAAMDSAAMAAPAASNATLAAYSGTWNMNTMAASSDSVLLRFTMQATGDTTGWVYNFPSSATPVPIRILSVDNGTVTTEAGPYSSNFRPGVQVVTRATVRIENDTLRGDVTATYAGGPGDSIVTLRTMGTRAH